LSSPVRSFTEDPYTGHVTEVEAHVDIEDDEFDDLSDPFLILAAREERAGVPLYHLTHDHND
jgi:hypothetical protein